MNVRNEQPTQSQSSIRQDTPTRNASNVSVHFNADNSDAVQELAQNGKFGNSPEEVVIFALRFLYTVCRHRPDANVLIAEGPSGRTYMDI